jgi:hypothetical protein
MQNNKYTKVLIKSALRKMNKLEDKIIKKIDSEYSSKIKALEKQVLVLQKKIKIAEETEKDFVNVVNELFKAENIIVEPSELLISMIRREMKFQLREDHWSSILKRRENLLN